MYCGHENHEQFAEISSIRSLVDSYLEDPLEEKGLKEIYVNLIINSLERIIDFSVKMEILGEVIKRIGESKINKYNVC